MFLTINILSMDNSKKFPALLRFPNFVKVKLKVKIWLNPSHFLIIIWLSALPPFDSYPHILLNESCQLVWLIEPFKLQMFKISKVFVPVETLINLLRWFFWPKLSQMLSNFYKMFTSNSI